MPKLFEQPQELIDYLRRTGHIGAEEQPQVSPLAGGVSNHTSLVIRPNGEQWVVKQALAKLRVRVDWYSDPRRIQREALGLRWLEKLAPPGTITPLVFEDHQHHLLAMQAVPRPHENWKGMLLAGRVEADHVRQFACLLASVHRHAWQQREQVAPVFDDRRFFESLRIEPYYAYTAIQAPVAAAFFDQLITDTRRRRYTLVHGDYSPKNILVREGRLMLLDHEVIHFGDPAFDLGFALCHLLSKAHHVRDHRRAFAEAAIQFARDYAAGVDDVPWRATIEPFAVRHTLGCLLARVAGRSTLEYLSDDERTRQRAVSSLLTLRPPPTVAELTEQFTRGL